MSCNFSIQFILSISFTVNINENKAGVITQIIARYTSEYCGNLNYNYQMSIMLDKAGVGYIPHPEILLRLNRVIINSELEGDGYIIY